MKKAVLLFLPTGRAAEASVAVLAAGLLLAGLAPAQAGKAAVESLSVTDAWFRTIVPDRPAGGYFTLRNESGRPRTMTGVSSPACGMAMMHETAEESGVAKMRRVQRIEVPAHGSITFAPGGRHIMCMKPTDAMAPGGTVPVKLEFADGTSLTADFAVKSASGE